VRQRADRGQQSSQAHAGPLVGSRQSDCLQSKETKHSQFADSCAACSEAKRTDVEPAIKQKVDVELLVVRVALEQRPVRVLGLVLAAEVAQDLSCRGAGKRRSALNNGSTPLWCGPFTLLPEPARLTSQDASLLPVDDLILPDADVERLECLLPTAGLAEDAHAPFADLALLDLALARHALNLADEPAEDALGIGEVARELVGEREREPRLALVGPELEEDEPVGEVGLVLAQVERHMGAVAEDLLRVLEGGRHMIEKQPWSATDTGEVPTAEHQGGVRTGSALSAWLKLLAASAYSFFARWSMPRMCQQS
jgi:hypothetical protein